MKSIAFLCLLFVLLFSAKGMKIRSQLEATSQTQATTGAQTQFIDEVDWGCVVACRAKYFFDLNKGMKCARNC
jgi:hypothetical protein